MASASTGRFLLDLRRSVRAADHPGRTDGQLLEEFLLRHEEEAFRVLLGRHGPMVLGVCRRVLGHAEDADDAFQATFVVLVRNAAALRRRETVGNWLYGVAYRTALKARAAAWKRRAREDRARRPVAYEDAGRDAALDLRPVLDQELNRLPEKYRGPVVLCHLEGKSRQAVARQLGIAEGTLSSRLATARRLLAKRLTRRGVALSGGALAALSAEAAPAAVAAPLVARAVQVAAQVVTGTDLGALPARVAALSEGGVRVLRLSGLKVVLTAVLAGGVLAAAVALHAHAGAESGAPQPGDGGIAASPGPADATAPARPPAGKVLAAKDSVSPAEPPPPSAPDGEDDEDALRRWEQEMNRVQSVRACFTQTVKDQTIERTEVYDGTVQYLKPNRASFELRGKGKAEVVAKYVISGTLLYEYAPRQKSVRVHNLPLPKSSLLAAAGDGVGSFLWGMSAEEARRRYDIKQVKIDRWYVYLEIWPHLPADRESFCKARLVLNRSTFLPRQFWVREPNGTERTWDIARVEVDVSLDRAEFDAPRLPAGWRLQRLPPSEGPRGRPSDRP